MKGGNSWLQQQNLSQNKTWPCPWDPLGLQGVWMLTHAFGQPSPCHRHKAMGQGDDGEASQQTCECPPQLEATTSAPHNGFLEAEQSPDGSILQMRKPRPKGGLSGSVG